MSSISLLLGIRNCFTKVPSFRTLSQPPEPWLHFSHNSRYYSCLLSVDVRRFCTSPRKTSVFQFKSKSLSIVIENAICPCVNSVFRFPHALTTLGWTALLCRVKPACAAIVIRTKRRPEHRHGQDLSHCQPYRITASTPTYRLQPTHKMPISTRPLYDRDYQVHFPYQYLGASTRS